MPLVGGGKEVVSDKEGCEPGFADAGTQTEDESGATWEELLSLQVPEFSAHGFSRALSKRGVGFRIVWLIISVVMLAFLSWTAWNLIEEYYQRPTRISTRAESFQSVEFPAVTVCNLNPLEQSKLDQDPEKFGLLYDYYAHSSRLVRSTLPPDAWKITRELQVAGAQDANDLIVDCVFGTRAADRPNCLPSNRSRTTETGDHDGDLSWKAFENSQFGQCYTFNDFAEPYRQSQLGMWAGLIAFLDVAAWNYMDTTVATGVMVMVHDQSDPPLFARSSFIAGPGNLYIVDLKRKDQERAEHPYGNCTREDKRPNLSPLEGYSREVCLRVCSADLMRQSRKGDSQRPCCNDGDEECEKALKRNFLKRNESCACPGCRIHGFESRGERGENGKMEEVPYCSNEEDERLAIKAYERGWCLGPGEPRQNYSCPHIMQGCPERCNDRDFRLSIHSLPWPAERFNLSKVTTMGLSDYSNAYMRDNNITAKEYMRQNFVGLSISYEDFIIETRNSSRAMGPFALLAAIGGNCGLFLGISFVSIVEILATLVDHIVVLSTGLPVRFAYWGWFLPLLLCRLRWRKRLKTMKARRARRKNKSVESNGNHQLPERVSVSTGATEHAGLREAEEKRLQLPKQVGGDPERSPSFGLEAGTAGGANSSGYYALTEGTQTGAMEDTQSAYGEISQRYWTRRFPPKRSNSVSLSLSLSARNARFGGEGGQSVNRGGRRSGSGTIVEEEDEESLVRRTQTIVPGGEPLPPLAISPDGEAGGSIPEEGDVQGPLRIRTGTFGAFQPQRQSI